MDIEPPVEKKHSDDEESSEEDNEVGTVTQKVDLKLDLIAANSGHLKKNENLLVADRIFLSLWGNSSIFLQSIINQLIFEKKGILVGYLNFNKAKQKALANVYSLIDSSSFVIIFNEAINDYTEYNFPEFLPKTFSFDPQIFEFVILDNISCKLLKKAELIHNLQTLRIISTNHHSKESFEAMKKLGVPLEEGNHMEGIGAEIVVFCEINKLKANFFLGINEEFEINVDDVKKFGNILPNYKKLKKKPMNKNNNHSKSPSLFHSQTKKIADPEYKSRPISALLSLKFLSNDIGGDQNKSILKNHKRYLSLEHLQRQKNKFNKTFILPEIEAKNQSFVQYIDDIANLYDTINNDKNEEFLPFYTITSIKYDIGKKFICLNRKTKTLPKKNYSLPKENRDGQLSLAEKTKNEKMKPKLASNLKIKEKKVKKPIEKEKISEKSDKSERELIDLLLQKENKMDKNNFNRIFALTEKDKIHSFTNKDKKMDKIDKNLKTFDINKFNEGSLHFNDQRDGKTNYFQNHLKEIKQSYHERSENGPPLRKEPKIMLEVLMTKKKKFNFSKANDVHQIFKSNEDFKRKKLKPLLNPNNVRNAKILIQNQTELKPISANLQGWNEDGHNDINLDEENF